MGNEANSSSSAPAMSADGRFIAFHSDANLVANDDAPYDVYLHDRNTGTTSRASDSPCSPDRYSSFHPAVSVDGRFVAFDSGNAFCTNSEGVGGVFLHDQQQTHPNGAERVSMDNSGNPKWGQSPSISGNGRLVAFESTDPGLLGGCGAGCGDTNGASDIFVRDSQAGTTRRISVDSFGNQSNGASYWPVISADGRFVAFRSVADNLVANNTSDSSGDVFVHDLQTGETELVSVRSTGASGNGWSGHPAISTDGRFVAFTSDASNLVLSDTNGWEDVFVRDRQTQTTERVSVATNGEEGGSISDVPAISGTGRFVAFQSTASNLINGDTNGVVDIFLHDRESGVTVRISESETGAQADAGSFGPAPISGQRPLRSLHVCGHQPCFRRHECVPRCFRPRPG